MLAFLPGMNRAPHPAAKVALALLAVMGFGLAHIDSILLSGVSQWLLNIAIWAPLFWVGRINVSPRTLRNALLLLWGFHVAGSIVGVLQVYDPDRFAPSPEFVRKLMGPNADALVITLSDGRRMWRPCGLSDTPGGAAASGSFAVVVGMMLVMANVRWFVRAAAAAGIVAGIFCIYICEIRSILIITVISVIALAAVQFFQGRLSRAATLAILAPWIAVGCLFWIKSVGGDAATDRLRTLTAAAPGSVYYRNRGVFIEHSLLEELPKYPLGAGLGRYGMMYSHFGDKRIRPLYAEVQLTAWLYDGGLLLVLLGYTAVGIACYVSLRLAISRRSDPLLRDYAAVIAALNIGWLAITFNYPLFLGQGGMIFWLLNGALFATAQRPERVLTRTQTMRAAATKKEDGVAVR